MPEPRGASQAAFLTLPRAAEYLGISPNTLYVWRHRRQGPPSFRMGRRVMYRITALDEWVRDQELADSRSNRVLDPLNRKPQRRSKPREVARWLTRLVSPEKKFIARGLDRAEDRVSTDQLMITHHWRTPSWRVT
ncbi:helix-turn-helix transcriptional regulator [Streptomyces sp. NPDC059896]|uniref:helix-turn-helix transcriptional regulator n=1 Tax=Streptomyces sp. NPDC059896 TaxID=3346993 RepID=UPI00364D6FD5